MNVRSFLFVAGAVALAFACAAPPPAPVAASSPTPSPSFFPAPASTHRAPLAAREPVKDRYHGVEVEDPYRWLEETSSERVKAFVKEQNDWARRYLDALPGRQALRARLQEILGAKFALYRLPAAVGKTMFAIKVQPPAQQPVLVAMAGPDGIEAERVLVDPNVMDASGHTAIDWFRPSPNGKYVMSSALDTIVAQHADAYAFTLHHLGF